MSSNGYGKLANIAAQGAGQQAYRENFDTRRQPPGMAGGNVGYRGTPEMECSFPRAPPHRVYCSPAAYNAIDGRDYHLLGVAYGASRPAANF